jgi:hypothetical protein
MDANTNQEPARPLWPALVLCAALAVWVDLGKYHRQQTADSIVPVLVSLYKWTPYFWDCNRIGMLLPLLALPFQHPLANLLIQSGLVLFAAFAVLFLLPRYLLRRSAWPAAGAAAVALFLLVVPTSSRFVFTFGQPHYPVALALGLGALVLLEDFGAPGRSWSRLAAAAVLMLLAHWVNSATMVFLGPLIVLRGVFLGRAGGEPTASRRWPSLLRGETAWALAALAVGCAGNFALQSRLPVAEDPATRGLLRVAEWPAAVRHLACNVWAAVVDKNWVLHDDSTDFRAAWAQSARGPVLAAVAGGAALLLLAPAVRRRAAGPVRAALVLAAASVLSALVLSSLQWVRNNHFHCRYGTPAVFFLLTALAAVAAAPLSAALAGKARALLGSAAVLSLFAAAAAGYGPPSLRRVRADLDDLRGLAANPPGYIRERAAEVLAAGCTHLAGRYAAVWPVIFQANLELYEHGSDRVVWGVAGRCLPTWDEWGRMAPEDLRVAVLREGEGLDPEGEFYLHGFFPPMTVVEKRQTLCVLRSADEVALGRGAVSAGPVRASWHSGFYPADGDNRWCRGRAKLTLYNVSDRPCTVTLDMDLRTGREEPSQLDLESPLFEDHPVVTGSRGHSTRTLAVPPGKNTVCFRCEARPLDAPGDWRRLVFRVEHFRLTEGGPRPCGPPQHSSAGPP